MGGVAYHVLNRAVGRRTIFKTDADYLAFERVMEQAWRRMGTRLVSYCVMPNHWHLVVWPRKDGELSEFLRWLTVTHTQRYHAHYRSAGTGPLYQGRFKSFPICRDEHFLTVCRYVERNPLRANLVTRADDWRWSSLWRRRNTPNDERAFLLRFPGEWPVAPPRNWLSVVTRKDKEEELSAVRHAVVRGAPFGDDRWRRMTAAKLGLLSTLRPRGRPRKTERKAGTKGTP